MKVAQLTQSTIRAKDLIALAEAYLVDAQEQINRVQARQFVMEHNSRMHKPTTAIAMMLADTADRALARGDKKAAEVFFNLAVAS